MSHRDHRGKDKNSLCSQEKLNYRVHRGLKESTEKEKFGIIFCREYKGV